MSARSCACERTPSSGSPKHTVVLEDDTLALGVAAVVGGVAAGVGIARDMRRHLAHDEVEAAVELDEALEHADALLDNLEQPVERANCRRILWTIARARA